MSTLPPHLRARILEAAKIDPAPTRASHRRSALLASLGAACVSLALSAALGGATAKRQAVMVAVAGIGAGLLALVVTWLAAGRGSSMLGRSRATLVAVSVAAPLALLAWSLASAAMDSNGSVNGESMHSHLGCFVFTLLFAAAPVAALAYVRRGSDPTHPRALGAALGGDAGAWGGMLIDVHCPFTSAVHLTLGHAAPIALLAALGALFGARILGLRT